MRYFKSVALWQSKKTTNNFLAQAFKTSHCTGILSYIRAAEAEDTDPFAKELDPTNWRKNNTGNKSTFVIFLWHEHFLYRRQWWKCNEEYRESVCCKSGRILDLISGKFSVLQTSFSF